jgi:phosphatidate phosphatase APP1
MNEEKISENISWVEHKSKRIWFADCKGLEGADLVERIEENIQAMSAANDAGEQDLLVLTDIRDTVVTTDVVDAFKRAASNMQPFTKASAVVGIYGVRKFLLNTVNRFSSVETNYFDTLEQAKDWLVEQSNS